MVSFSVNIFLKHVWYLRCNFSISQDFTYDQTQEYFLVHSSSCKSLSSKSSCECASLVESWNWEVDHLKDYVFPKDSFLFNLSINMGLLLNLMLQICPLIALEILLSRNDCTSCHMNQVLLHSPYPNWSHAFMVLESFLNSFDDYNACSMCHPL